MSAEISNSKDIKDTNYFTMLERMIDYIKESNIQKGERLPNENQLADEIYINRSTLRECLRVLEAFGVITSKRGAGNIYTCDLEIGFMNLFMISNGLLDGQPLDVNNLRAVIEADAIEEFIKHATDYDIFMLEMIYNEQMKTVADKRTREYLSHHIMFHDQIMKYNTNDIAKHLVHSGIRMVDNERISRFNTGAEKATPSQEVHLKKVQTASHESILQAIKEKNIEKAKSLMITHILIPGEIIETL